MSKYVWLHFRVIVVWLREPESPSFDWSTNRIHHSAVWGQFFGIISWHHWWQPFKMHEHDTSQRTAECRTQLRRVKKKNRERVRKKHARAVKIIKRNFWITGHESKRFYQLPQHASSWLPFIFKGNSIWWTDRQSANVCVCPTSEGFLR